MRGRLGEAGKVQHQLDRHLLNALLGTRSVKKVPLVKSVHSTTRDIFSCPSFIQLLLNAVDCMPSRLKPRPPSSLLPCRACRQYGHQPWPPVTSSVSLTAGTSSHLGHHPEQRAQDPALKGAQTRTHGVLSGAEGTSGGMAPPAVSGDSPNPPPWLGATHSQGPL